MIHKPNFPRLGARLSRLADVRIALLCSALTAIAAGCASPSSDAQPNSDYYEDWKLCAANCVPGSVGEVECLDACTDDFNNTHNNPQNENPPPFRLKRNTGESPNIGGIVECPAGSALSPFMMPIYDKDGLFVVDFETVWFCLPKDLEPAG